jgi:hypothetical protein
LFAGLISAMLRLGTHVPFEIAAELFGLFGGEDASAF